MTTALPRGATAFTARREGLAIVALTVVAALLRFTTLDVQSFGLDDTFTVAAIGDGLGHVFSAVSHTESTPPLYYVLAWAWAQFAGTGEVGLRTLSALLGTATVPVAYLSPCGCISRASHPARRPPRALAGFRLAREAHDTSTQLQILVARRPRLVSTGRLAAQSIGPPLASVVALSR